jgi:hypothetical protein
MPASSRGQLHKSSMGDSESDYDTEDISDSDGHLNDEEKRAK